jgi:hypothetical protein
MSNKGRTITVVLTIDDPEAAKAIWERHMDDGLLAGCRVGSIANGDQLEKLEEAIGMMTEEQAEEFQFHQYDE